MEVCEYNRMDTCTRYIETSRVEPKDCSCYPTCSSITYNYEIVRFQRSNVSEKYTTMAFKYKDGEHFALLRYQPFKLVDFLSYVGGILGLFAGVSALSIIELCYYFTLRILSNIMRHFSDVYAH
jgi:amiloride-sensitive sodium channel